MIVLRVMKQIKIYFYTLLLLWCSHSLLFGQSFNNGFPFSLPANDTTASQFLPYFPVHPITIADTISIDGNGHFSKQGEAYRFWGTNLVADGAFPDHGKTSFIAGRLRKLGFNLIRFHHLDNPWSSRNIFVSGNTRHLNPVTLDRLEHFIAELKRNGIYTNMNLNVGRTFTAADGVPDTDSLVEFAKGVTQFDPQLIALQKEYAYQLLTHVNPYTGLTLAQDPALAVMEIANENSLYKMWRSGSLVPFSNGGILTVRHNRMLDSMWNAFLSEKYQTTANLDTAWLQGSVPDTSANQVHNGDLESGVISDGWDMETHSSAQAIASVDHINPYHGTSSAKVNVSTSDGVGWHLQWKQTGLRVIKDSTYEVSFAARADSARGMQVIVMKDTDPYTGYGSGNFTLTTEWNVYTFRFTAPETCLTETRLSFTVGEHKGTYWFDDIGLTEAPVNGLFASETLEDSKVRRTLYSESRNFTDQRIRDMSSFYITTMQHYFQTMLSYLKDTLGVRAPIVGTNTNVGPGDLVAQSDADYFDNHAYWQHPWFPNVAWSSTDWQIENTPMVSNSDGGTIGELFSGIAYAGKPYSIGEYDQPYPNSYQCESPVFLSAYGSFHNADALMFYEYNQSSSSDWETDFVNGFFDNHRNTVMMGLMPSLSSAFRKMLIHSSVSPVAVNYSTNDYLLQPKHDPGAGWEAIDFVPRNLALSHEVRIHTFSSSVPFNPASLPAVGTSPFVTDTRKITWNVDSTISVQTPTFAAVSGYLNNATIDSTAPLNIIQGDGFGTVTWISCQGTPLATAESSLVTLVSRVQNSGMIWDGISTVHDQWGTAPTSIQSRTITIRIVKNSSYLRILPLDVHGNATTVGYLVAPIHADTFDIVLDQTIHPTIWFGIVSVSTLATNDAILNGGWNLVSVPLKPLDNHASVIFPEVTGSVFTYSHGYVQADTLTMGKGYWVKYPVGTVIHHVGNLIQIDTIIVTPGWNLTGSISVPVEVNSIVSIPTGIITSQFYGYENGYSVKDTLFPAKGYWVKASTSGKLILQSNSGSHSSEAIHIKSKSIKRSP